MTASSMLEARLRDRPDSTIPAEAVETILEVEPETEAAERRLANLVHWACGTACGGVRGLIAAAGLRGVPAGVVHFGVVRGAGLVLLAALRLTPPPTSWGTEVLAVDALHHAVYAAATGTAFEAVAPD